MISIDENIDIPISVPNQMPRSPSSARCTNKYAETYPISKWQIIIAATAIF